MLATHMDVNDIIFNIKKSEVMFFYTIKSGHVTNIMLGEMPPSPMY